MVLIAGFTPFIKGFLVLLKIFVQENVLCYCHCYALNEFKDQFVIQTSTNFALQSVACLLVKALE